MSPQDRELVDACIALAPDFEFSEVPAVMRGGVGRRMRVTRTVNGKPHELESEVPTDLADVHRTTILGICLRQLREVIR